MPLQKSTESALDNIEIREHCALRNALFVYWGAVVGTMVLWADDGTRRAGKRGKDLDFEVISAGKLHTTVVQNLGAVLDQTEHFFIADLQKTLGIGIDPGVSVVNTVYIRKDLAKVRSEERRVGKEC